jgi:hypothetical protein
MKKISLVVLTLAVALTTGSVVLADNTDDLAMLKEMSGYREWVRLNQQPIVVPAVSLLG